MKKIKLLFYGDSPTVTTGFATVSKNILKRLHATGKYDITVIGINYYGELHELPYKIFPAVDAGANPPDLYGRARLLKFLQDGDFDILFTLQDTFVMRTVSEAIRQIRDGEEVNGVQLRKKKFKWLFYFPIDAKPRKEWITGPVADCDIAVPYTEYAKTKCQEFLDREYHVIYHGGDFNDFYEMTEEEKDSFRKKEFKGVDFEDHFLVVNVNRNQQRKDLFRTLLVFKKLLEKIPNALLYTHCDVVGDVGGNITLAAHALGIDEKHIYPNPENYRKKKNFSVKYVNGVYNIADVNMSTTLGEGFGLSMVEAMLTKTVNVFPDNTAITEILEGGRGVLAVSGGSIGETCCLGNVDNGLIRPLVNVDDMADKIAATLISGRERRAIEKRAYVWAKKNLSWDKNVAEFDRLITNAI